jgi:GxxExxY protein
MKPEDTLSNVIIGAAIEVHTVLGGPGLLECVYEEALVYELELRGLEVKRQVSVSIQFKGHELHTKLKIDLVVNDLVIVECKAVEILNTIALSQILTYLKLSGLKLGLVINFGDKLIKNGTHRVVNQL